MERKDTKARMEALKKRLRAAARTEEGQAPPEDPAAMLNELYAEVLAFESLVARIDRTNAIAAVADGSSLVDALVRRDMLRYRHLVVASLCEHAVASTPARYSARELRQVPAIDVSRLRREADRFARDARLLDAQIQKTNWATPLVDP